MFLKYYDENQKLLLIAGTFNVFTIFAMVSLKQVKYEFVMQQLCPFG